MINIDHKLLIFIIVTRVEGCVPLNFTITMFLMF